MTSYVVAGVTGRVGSVVAGELLARGAATTVIVRNEASRAAWARRGAGVAFGSLDDSTFLARTLRGASGFFTLLPENVGPDDFHGARRRMAEAMATAVADSAVPHIVMLSAIAAVLPDGNGPAKDLHYCERRLASIGTTLTVLRACYFQDNVSSVLTPARQQSIYPHFMPSADAPVPMVATNDVGRFAAEALLRPPESSVTIDVLGPPYSIRQVAERLGGALGKPLQIVAVPPAERVAVLMQSGVPQQMAVAVAEMFAAFEAGRITPQSDRQLFGTTTIDEVIAGCLRRQRAAASM